MGHEEGVGCQSVGCQSAAGVESEPSEPEESGADEYERNVVGSEGLARTVVLTPAYEQCHDEGRHSGIDMHHRAAGKVDGSHVHQEAAAPYPVSHRQIDEDAPQNREEEES